MSVAPRLLDCRVNMTYFVKNYEILMTYFKSRQPGNTSMIVHVRIVILIFLEWSISLNCYFVIKPIFRDSSSINESPFETEFDLNRGLITEPIFRDFFSIWVNIIFCLGKSLS